MEAFLIVEAKPAAEALAEFSAVVESMEVKILVFHSPPEAFDKNVITEVTLAIHADLDVVVFQGFCKSKTGKLAALIGVEDLRAAIKADRFLQSRYAEIGIKGIGKAPGQHLAAVPVPLQPRGT
jgi:hypothetical protein